MKTNKLVILLISSLFLLTIYFSLIAQADTIKDLSELYDISQIEKLLGTNYVKKQIDNNNIEYWYTCPSNKATLKILDWRIGIAVELEAKTYPDKKYSKIKFSNLPLGGVRLGDTKEKVLKVVKAQGQFTTQVEGDITVYTYSGPGGWHGIKVKYNKNKVIYIYTATSTS